MTIHCSETPLSEQVAQIKRFLPLLQSKQKNSPRYVSPSKILNDRKLKYCENIHWVLHGLMEHAFICCAAVLAAMLPVKRQIYHQAVVIARIYRYRKSSVIAPGFGAPSVTKLPPVRSCEMYKWRRAISWLLPPGGSAVATRWSHPDLAKAGFKHARLQVSETALHLIDFSLFRPPNKEASAKWIAE